MKTLSSVLKDSRLNQKISLAEVSQKTRIPLIDLTNIESDAWQGKYAYPYLQGKINKYAKFLNLNLENVNALFRREVENASVNFIPKRQRIAAPLKIPRSMYLLIFLLLFLLLFGLQLFLAWQKPLLTVNKLPSAIKYNQPLVVSGKTELGVLLYLNDEQIFQDEEGNFSEELFFKKGKKTLVLKAIGKNGKIEEKQFKVEVK